MKRSRSEVIDADSVSVAFDAVTQQQAKRTEPPAGTTYKLVEHIQPLDKLKTHTAYHPKSTELYFFSQTNTRTIPKENKQFACPVEDCSKGYSRVSDLRNHFSMIHPERLDEYPFLRTVDKFTCEMCKASFARKRSLLNHVKQHFHEGKVDHSDGKVDNSCDEDKDSSLEDLRLLVEPKPAPKIQTTTKFSVSFILTDTN
jgi:hypothetical protein